MRLIPDVSLLVFKCIAFVHGHGPNKTKFIPRAQNVSSLGIPFTSEGESTSEETNWSTSSVPINLPELLPEPILSAYDTILPSRQVSWINYYRKNLIKEMVSPTTPSSLVHEFEPMQAQGTTRPNNNTNLCGKDDIVDLAENDRNDMLVLENNRVAGSDETLIETREVEILPQDGKCNQNSITYKESDKPEDYALSLDIPIALKKGTRSCTKHPKYSYKSYSNLSSKFRAFATSLNTVIIPKNIHIAIEISKWKISKFRALENTKKHTHSHVLSEISKFRALEKNNIWNLINLSKGHKTVGCKWVFTLKYKLDETLNKYKARLVAKWFTQTYGINYS
ncbi:uncharacterized protein LOC120089084 [Benincasa hispida]|uniref:uncharacterized protein LOC120089084 n=1 Tax=Benincasa hispida TaxID=102211 RepID=UPI00190282D7|nr:uncharacterized protein LOC120089084 [Benincasa hispida]